MGHYSHHIYRDCKHADKTRPSPTSTYVRRWKSKFCSIWRLLLMKNTRIALLNSWQRQSFLQGTGHHRNSRYDVASLTLPPLFNTYVSWTLHGTVHNKACTMRSCCHRRDHMVQSTKWMSLRSQQVNRVLYRRLGDAGAVQKFMLPYQARPCWRLLAVPLADAAPSWEDAAPVQNAQQPPEEMPAVPAASAAEMGILAAILADLPVSYGDGTSAASSIASSSESGDDALSAMDGGGSASDNQYGSDFASASAPAAPAAGMHTAAGACGLFLMILT